jgi:hypothetical protein
MAAGWGAGPGWVGGAGPNKSADSNGLALSLDLHLGLGSVLVDVPRRVNRWLPDAPSW